MRSRGSADLARDVNPPTLKRLNDTLLTAKPLQPPIPIHKLLYMSDLGWIRANVGGWQRLGWRVQVEPLRQERRRGHLINYEAGETSSVGTFQPDVVHEKLHWGQAFAFPEVIGSPMRSVVARLERCLVLLAGVLSTIRRLRIGHDIFRSTSLTRISIFVRIARIEKTMPLHARGRVHRVGGEVGLAPPHNIGHALSQE